MDLPDWSSSKDRESLIVKIAHLAFVLFFVECSLKLPPASWGDSSNAGNSLSIIIRSLTRKLAAGIALPVHFHLHGRTQGKQREYKKTTVNCQGENPDSGLTSLRIRSRSFQIILLSRRHEMLLEKGNDCMSRRAQRPFIFYGCMELREILGKTAENEKELADLIEEVPSDSIFYHTHSFLLRHRSTNGEYMNDFANWVATEVEDRVLSERLGIIDPCEFETLEALREEILSIIDDHLAGARIIPQVIFGESFSFMQSRIIQIPTGLEVYTLSELCQGLEEIDISAIYFHFFEVRHRLKRREYDIPLWLIEELGLNELSEQIRKIRLYSLTLEQLRSKLLSFCGREMEGRREER